MAKTSEVTVKVDLDTEELLKRLDNLPDEILDRLADKLMPRIEQRVAQWRRLQGQQVR